MSEQKTALELVDEIIACPGCPSIKHLTCLKSAIERERAEIQSNIDWLRSSNEVHAAQIKAKDDALKSAITMRPISELPDRVPDGCAVFAVGADNSWTWMNPDAKLNNLVESIKLMREVGEPTHFYIIPLPKPERRLHPCYMPGCEKDVGIQIVGVQYRVVCECGLKGPSFDTVEKAKKAWGYEE